jgi:phage FluMu protein Com
MKLQLIESFSTVSLEKKFPLKKFLNQFSVSNKDLTKIKKQLIELFSELKNSELIYQKLYARNAFKK